MNGISALCFILAAFCLGAGVTTICVRLGQVLKWMQGIALVMLGVLLICAAFVAMSF